MIKNDLLVGVAGEHLVCCDLICNGYNAFMTDQGLPYDLILDVDDKLLRVQVKTTRTHTELPQRKTRFPSYLFHVRRCGNGGKKDRLTVLHRHSGWATSGCWDEDAPYAVIPAKAGIQCL